MTESPVDEVATAAPTPDGSIQGALRAALAAAQHRQNKDFPIPGYSGRLWGTFRALDDYTDVRGIVAGLDRVSDDATKELYIAADTIIKSCVGVYALMDGEKHELPYGMGIGLADYLGQQVDTDRQAVFALFPGTLAVMGLLADLDAWFKDADAKSAEETAGNSEAPS